MNEELKKEIELVKSENESLINLYNSHIKEIEEHQKSINELQNRIVENNGALKRLSAIVDRENILPIKE